MTHKHPEEIRRDLTASGWQCHEECHNGEWKVLLLRGELSLASAGRDRASIWNAIYREATRIPRDESSGAAGT